MKFLVIAACLFAVTYGLSQEALDKFKEKVHKLGAECKIEVHATEDDIAPILKHDPPTTEAGKCFLACLNKKIGFMDASGKISKEGAYAAIEKLKAIDADLFEKMKKVADVCLAEVTDGANECETAAAMCVCVKREEEANGVDPITFN